MTRTYTRSENESVLTSDAVAIAAMASPSPGALSGFSRGSVGQSSYMIALQSRIAHETLKGDVIFGLVLGWVFTLVGAFKTFVLLEGGLSVAMLSVGIVALSTAVAAPFLLAYPKNLIHKIVSPLATLLFKGILSIVYVLTVLPVGLAQQKIVGRDPFYFWTDECPAQIEGWVAKDSSDERSSGHKSHGALAAIIQPIEVVGYFLSRGQWIILPCLLLLLILGLVAVFVQSSAVAPFIYTLF